MAITVEQYRAKLRKQIEEIRKENVPLFLASTTGVSLLTERIFQDGMDSSMTKIGRYSRKPIYISPSASPKSIEPQGKTGKKIHDNGKPYKTKYYGDGYKGYKKGIGREHRFVNLRLTNDLQSDVSNNVVSKGTTKFKGNVKVKQLNKDTYFVDLREENVEKMKGLEKHFGTTIFKHTKEERDEVIRVYSLEMKKQLS